MTPDALDQALRWFETAIEMDPSYAPAYAGVAWTWQCRRQIKTALAKGRVSLVIVRDNKKETLIYPK